MIARVNVDLSLGCPLPALVDNHRYESCNDYCNRRNLKSGFDLAASVVGDNPS